MRLVVVAKRKQKLKVFRTPIGFHDAYVAAPSQKAALEAWGADSNLFAQGIAEQVEEAELVKEPLERPGEVIKRLRGSAADQVKALGRAPPPPKRRKEEEKGGPRIPRSGSRAGKPGVTKKGKIPKLTKRPKPPKPSRAELEAAEEALEAAEKLHRSEIRNVEREIEVLERRARELRRRHERKRDELAEVRDHAGAAYERAKRAWKKL